MRKSSVVLAVLMAGLSFGAMANTPAPKEYPAQLDFCSGGQGGYYETIATSIGNAAVAGTPVKLNVVNTGGSVDSASRLKSGECNIAILQADATATLDMPAEIEVTDAHVETAFWIFAPGKGVEDFGKMEDDEIMKKYSVVTVKGSGALVTLKNWVTTDKDYKGVNIIEVDDWFIAAKAAAQGHIRVAKDDYPVAGLLYIGRPGKLPSDIVGDYGDVLKVGEVNDDSFDGFKDANGTPLYTACTINNDAAKPLKVNTTLNADTYCLRAQVVYNPEWTNGLPKNDARDMNRAVLRATSAVVKTVRIK